MLDQGMRRMLRDFGRALSDAISESGEASRKLRKIRERGYSLYLLLDGSTEPEACADGLEDGARRSRPGTSPRRVQRNEAAKRLESPRRIETPKRIEIPERIEAIVPNRKPEREPQFRINGTDLSFLRSIGIDPTRRQRRRRS